MRQQPHGHQPLIQEQAPQRKSVMLVPRADGKGLEKKEVWLPDLKAPQPPKPLLVEIRTSRVLSVDKAGNLVVATHRASRAQAPAFGAAGAAPADSRGATPATRSPNAVEASCTEAGARSPS